MQLGSLKYIRIWTGQIDVKLTPNAVWRIEPTETNYNVWLSKAESCDIGWTSQKLLEILKKKKPESLDKK